MRPLEKNAIRKEAIRKAGRHAMRAAMISALGPSNLDEHVEEQLIAQRGSATLSKAAALRSSIEASWAAEGDSIASPTSRQPNEMAPSWAAVNEFVAKSGPYRVALEHLVDRYRDSGDDISVAELSLARASGIPHPNVIGSREWAARASALVHRARKEEAVLAGFGVAEALQTKTPTGASWGGPVPPPSGIAEQVRHLLDREPLAETAAAPTDSSTSATSSVSGTSESWSSRR